MYIVASFPHSLFVELVISEIEEMGVKQEQILALPLDKRNEKPKLFDNMHYADGVSFLDLALALGTIGMLLGGIYGFVLPLGPILWALFGLVTGSLLGFVIKFIVFKRTRNKQYKVKAGLRTRPTELFVMIQCIQSEAERIEHILWTHHALGVGTLL